MQNLQFWKSEAQFQAASTKWFDRNYPEQRGRLILLYNNPPNAIVGAMLKSMGLQNGASDQMYIVGLKRIAFIEYKILKRIQGDDQITFQALVESQGFEYYLIRSSIMDDIDPFINLIKTLNNG